ncbi:hypothetical protein GCM10009647_075110 [Streptomyces sanglieri]
MNRRSILASVTGGVAIGVLGTGIGAAEETKGDAIPNPNVPDADIYAFPSEEEPITVENGKWITFSNGWVYTETGQLDDCNLPQLLNNTTQTFSIDGEEFVLDSLDDWDFDPDADGEDNQGNEIFCEAEFSHSISPKPPGTTFTVRWELEIDDEEAVEGEYPGMPYENEVEVVRRGGNR